MFIGEYSHNMDDKGRLAIPAKFRFAISSGAVVTRGLDNCLFLYTHEEWEKMAIKLAAMPISQASSRAFSRLMLAGAMDVEFDKQGRIILPEYLRRYAGLTKNIIVAGLYNHLEIWDKKIWDKYKEDSEKSGGDIAEKLTALGI